MKTTYQTVRIADISISAEAQLAIKALQMCEDKVIGENLGAVALRLCENGDTEKAAHTLELIHSVLLARDYLTVIGANEQNE